MVEKELCMRVYLTSSPCVFPWTTLSSHPKSSSRQCASIQILTSLATFVLTYFRTNGLQLMIAEPFFCPFRVCWESLTQRVLSTAMLQHCGTIRKITKKWSTNSILLVKLLRADFFFISES